MVSNLITFNQHVKDLALINDDVDEYNKSFYRFKFLHNICNIQTTQQTRGYRSVYNQPIYTTIEKERKEKQEEKIV